MFERNEKPICIYPLQIAANKAANEDWDKYMDMAVDFDFVTGVAHVFGSWSSLKMQAFSFSFFLLQGSKILIFFDAMRPDTLL